MLLLIAVVSFFILGLLMYKYAYAPYGVLKRMGVKGPAPRPFWGNAQELDNDLVAMFQKLQNTYGDISGFYIGAMPVVLIADQELLKLVLVKQFDSFTDRADFFANGLWERFGLPTPLVFSKGEQWRDSRHAISPTFTGGRMKQMVPMVQECIKKLENDFLKLSTTGESIDMKRQFGLFTMESVLAVAFGRDVKLRTSDGKEDPLIIAARSLFDFQKTSLSKMIFRFIALKSHFPFVNTLLSYITPKSMEESFGYLYNTLKALIENRRKEEQSAKHHDFLQLILDLEYENASAHEGQKAALFTNSDIISHCLSFLLAGFDTTSTCLAFTSYLLAVNPEVQDQLCLEVDEYFEDHSTSVDLYEATHELKYLDMVVQESLRIFPPGLILGRTSIEDVEVGGLKMPKGTTVLVPIPNIHNDKTIWENPENFRPERFSPEEKEKRPQLCHMPFGWGPRNCIGMRFAVMEIKMVLMSILRKYKFVQAVETEVPLETISPGGFLVPKNGIFLKIQSRL